MKKWFFFLVWLQQSFAVTVDEAIPLALIDPVSVREQTPLLSINLTGDAVVVWKDFSSEKKKNEVLKMSYREKNVWSNPVCVSGIEKKIHRWTAAVYETGNLLFLWANQKNETWSAIKKKNEEGCISQFVFKLKDLPYASIRRNGYEECCFLVGKEEITEGNFDFKTSTFMPTQFLQKPDGDIFQDLAFGTNEKRRECIFLQKDRKILFGIGYSVFHFSLREKGEKWTAFEELYWKSPKYLEDFQLSMDEKENVCVVGSAEASLFGKYKLWAWTRSEQKWANEPIFLSDEVKDITNIQVRHDNNGNCMVLWTVTDGKNCRTYTAFKTFGQSWSKALPISLEGTQTAAILRVTPSGNFCIIWQQEERKSGVGIYGKVFSALNQEWSLPCLLSPSGKTSFFADFVWDLEGKGTLLWLTQVKQNALQLEVATVHFD
jgi:hypothetical protein